MGYLFNASTEKFVNSHPGAACVLFTPRWSTLSMILYLFYLATLKLSIALQPNWVMELNHEKLALQLNISVMVLCLVDTGVALLISGSTCDTVLTTLYIRATTGLDFNKENNFESSGPSIFTPTTLIIVLLSVIEYAVAEIIVNLPSLRVGFARCRRRISNHINLIGEDRHINRDNNVLPLESSAQSRPHMVPAVNNLGGHQQITHFQKTMILIKGMGFFAGAFLLLACIFVFFFELSFIILLILRIGSKLLLQCTPVYWGLVVDDVYELTKRRTAPLLASVYHYFTEDKVHLRNAERIRRVTPFRPQENGSQQEDDVPNAGTSPREARSQVNGSQISSPIAGTSTSSLRWAEKTYGAQRNENVSGKVQPDNIEAIPEKDLTSSQVLKTFKSQTNKTPGEAQPDDDSPTAGLSNTALKGSNEPNEAQIEDLVLEDVE